MVKTLLRRLPPAVYLLLVAGAFAVYFLSPATDEFRAIFLVLLSFPWSLTILLETWLAPDSFHESSRLGMVVIAVGFLLNFKLLCLTMECLFKTADSQEP